MAKRLSVLATPLLLTLVQCGPNLTPAPVTKWDPVCHCIVAQYSPNVTVNYPPVETTRKGPVPAKAWPDPGPRGNVPTGGILAPNYPFPMLDVSESATMGVILTEREALEFFTVGPELGLAPPGGIGAGNIMMRLQDASGTFGGYGALAQGSYTSAPGGPLGTSATRTVRGMRVSATTAGTHTYLCVVDDQGHIDLAERRGQPAVDGGGAPILEALKWVSIGANALVIWTDLNDRIAGAPGSGFRDVACAALANPAAGLDELHILGVASDGRVWHSLATRATADPLASSFTPFAQVTSLPANMRRIAAAAAENQLHVVGLGEGQNSGLAPPVFGQPWYTVRAGTGAWSSAVNVRDQFTSQPQQIGYMDVAVGFCDEGVTAPAPYPPHQLNVALLAFGGKVEMTAHTTWAQPWGDGGANATWLHESQWDGVLNTPTSSLVQNPHNLHGISLSERPFLPY